MYTGGSRREEMYVAHSLENKPISEWQTLADHSKGVSELAVNNSSLNCFNSWKKVAAFLHDLGKTSKEFQGYIRDANGIEDDLTQIYKKYGSQKVDHATAGAQYAVKTFGKELGKILAYVIAGHHTGLPNGYDDTSSSLTDRLKKEIPEYDPTFLSEFDYQLNQEELPFVNKTVNGFSISFFIRMLFSSLVDADFLDTEKFMSGEKSLERKTQYPTVTQLWEKLYRHLSSFDPKSSIVNRIRYDILKNCLDSAIENQGFFSLTVPTGGGKTLSSMAFALKHAMKNNLKRIIYVIPYTSIIEQTGNTFREIFGEDIVLEHHSNFDPKKETRHLKLASENWDVPIIVTTNVQFFESLFSNKTSKTRKINRISDSVIILDEAQMLPIQHLSPTIRCLRELVENYNSTVVFCTATQPVLNQSPEFKQGLENVKELIPNPLGLQKQLSRVEPILLSDTIDDESLIEQTKEYNQCLIVVSTKKHARNLYDISNHPNKYHLSSFMCPEHRSDVIKQIKSLLQKNQPCFVVSTQLIEAGVDVDFPVVFRSLAGIDSLAQAAGRCNREGKLKDQEGKPIKGKFYIFKSETPPPPGLLRQAAEITEQVLRHNPNPLSLEAIKNFFQRLYWQQSEQGLDKKNILRSLESELPKMYFPFKDIAENYKLIDDEGQNLIIPYTKESEKIIDKIKNLDINSEEDLKGLSKLQRQAQRHSVNVNTFTFQKLVQAGVIESYLNEKFHILSSKEIYKKDLSSIGLNPEDPNYMETCLV